MATDPKKSEQSIKEAQRTAEKTESDPAVERGERIQSTKDIARAGKSHGKVPGAERQDEEHSEEEHSE